MHCKPGEGALGQTGIHAYPTDKGVNLVQTVGMAVWQNIKGNMTVTYKAFKS